VSGIRSARTELGLAPGKPMPLMAQNPTDADLERLERFVANAPPEVSDKERRRLAEHSAKVGELEAQVEKLRART